MEAIQNDELFDDALRGMVKFTDATEKPQKTTELEKKSETKLHCEENKTPRTATREPLEAEYETAKTWYDLKVVNFVKWPLLFIGLEYLIFYWQQTGKMDESAAMPSMIVCALLAGISVGKNWRWRN